MSLTSQLPSRKHPNGVRLLALDGGGVRGIASLVILREIMRRVQAKLGTDKPCLPVDFFELATGTSTGGIIEQYYRIAEQVFSPKLWGWNISWLPGASYINNGKLLFQSTRFDAKPLRRAVDDVVVKFGLDDNDRKKKGQASLFHKAAGGMFFCTTAQNRVETVLMKSYQPGDSDAPKPQVNDALKAGGMDFTIETAALATSAAPTFFPAVPWKAPGQRLLTFWDGGLLKNSPIDQVWYNRFELVGPTEDEPDVSCLISLGTGYVRPAGAPADLIPAFRILGTVKEVISFATNANASGKDFSRHLALLKTRIKYSRTEYIRFNPNLGTQEIGLGDYTMMKKLEEMTIQYLEGESNQKYINDAVNAICP